MNAMRWVAAGAIGGLIGAFIWGAITYFLNAEIGWIAWGIGGLVGVCVRYIAGEGEEGAFPGIVAVGLSAGSILLGKYFAAVMLVAGLGGSVFTADDMKLIIANGEVETGREYESWEQVPADQQTKAEGEWATKSPEEQAEILKLLNDSVQISSNDVFMNSFGPFDILWFLLAAGTAYRLGSGTGSDSD